MCCSRARFFDVNSSYPYRRLRRKAYLSFGKYLKTSKGASKAPRFLRLSSRFLRLAKSRSTPLGFYSLFFFFTPLFLRNGDNLIKNIFRRISVLLTILFVSLFVIIILFLFCFNYRAIFFFFFFVTL